MYFLLFGLSGEPFLELTPPSPVSGKLKIIVDSKGVYRTNGPSSLPYLPTPSPGTTLASSTALSGGGGGGVANAAGTTSGIFYVTDIDYHYTVNTLVIKNVEIYVQKLLYSQRIPVSIST